VRVLVVTAATGQGHVSAARALGQALAEAGAEASILDAGENAVIRSGAASYNFFLRRPPGWMRLYFAAIHVVRADRVGGFLTRRWVERIYRRELPEVVVSVHPMFNFAIAEAIARKALPMQLFVVLTDFAPPFWTGWAEPRARLTFAPTAAAASQLAAWGIPRQRIVVAGMPVAGPSAAGASPGEKAALLRELGLDDSRCSSAPGRPGATRRSRSLRPWPGPVRSTHGYRSSSPRAAAGSWRGEPPSWRRPFLSPFSGGATTWARSMRPPMPCSPSPAA
jgi:hypothetical protein